MYTSGDGNSSIRKSSVDGHINITATELETLAKQFVARVPAQTFSGAEIQGHLLRWKWDPQGALADGDRWAKDLLATKAIWKS